MDDCILVLIVLIFFVLFISVCFNILPEIFFLLSLVNHRLCLFKRPWFILKLDVNL